MRSLVKHWLKSVPWASVVAINANLCEAAHALHKPTSEGYEPAKALWEKRRAEELNLRELVELGYKCHRLAPFCNYNGNTFVAVIKTLLAETTSKLPADKAHILRSVAGHIVAGTATAGERAELDKLLKGLE